MDIRRMTYRALLLLVVAIFALTSCEMNDLVEYGTTHNQTIRVAFDGVGEENYWGVDHHDVPLMPRSLNMEFYAVSEYAVSAKFKVNPYNLSAVELTPGTYDMLCYTSDFYSISGLNISRYTSIDGFEISAIIKSKSLASKSDVDENDDSESIYDVVIRAPDPMFYQIKRVEVSPQKPLVLSLKPGTHKYKVIFPCKNINYISGGIFAFSSAMISRNLYSGDYPSHIDSDGTQIDAADMILKTSSGDDDYPDEYFSTTYYSIGVNELFDMSFTLGFDFSTGSSVFMQLSNVDLFLPEDLDTFERDMKMSNSSDDPVRKIIYPGQLDALDLMNLDGFDLSIEDWEDVDINVTL